MKIVYHFSTVFGRYEHLNKLVSSHYLQHLINIFSVYEKYDALLEYAHSSIEISYISTNLHLLLIHKLEF